MRAKPIDTAPKDGTRILLRFYGDSWASGNWSEREADWYVDAPGVYGDCRSPSQPDAWCELPEEEK